jgi:6-phosphogluconolactonase (cycloisomerase 2 family)
MPDPSAHPAGPLVGRRPLLAAGLAGAASTLLPAAARAAGGAMFVYVGAYTKNPPGGGNDNPVGFSVFRCDPGSGALTPVQQVKSPNPSFVALHPSRRYLYVTNEIEDYEGKKNGSVEAYAIDPKTGMVKLINRQATGDGVPAHLAADPTGKHLVIANYFGGDFIVLPIEEGGRLGPVSGEIKDSGTGPNKERQEAPHPHDVVFDRAGHFIAGADLGIDKVITFRIAGNGLAKVGEASVAPGAGPRHLAFHLSNQVLYVLSELNATVTVFAFDPATGLIGKELQTISTEPEGYNGPHSTAEIAVHPSGKFLYASNRGYNSIVGYRIDPATSQLAVIGHVKEGVNFPRSFAIDPAGKWLYCANQKADTIVQFAIDPESGELKPTGQVTKTITPVAMVFRTAD